MTVNPYLTCGSDKNTINAICFGDKIVYYCEEITKMKIVIYLIYTKESQLTQGLHLTTPAK